MRLTVNAPAASAARLKRSNHSINDRIIVTCRASDCDYHITLLLTVNIRQIRYYDFLSRTVIKLAFLYCCNSQTCIRITLT